MGSDGKKMKTRFDEIDVACSEPHEEEGGETGPSGEPPVLNLTLVSNERCAPDQLIAFQEPNHSRYSTSYFQTVNSAPLPAASRGNHQLATRNEKTVRTNPLSLSRGIFFDDMIAHNPVGRERPDVLQPFQQNLRRHSC